MKRIKLISSTLFFVLSISLTAAAGNIATGKTGVIPTGKDGVIPTGKDGVIPTGKTGVISTVTTSASGDAGPVSLALYVVDVVSSIL